MLLQYQQLALFQMLYKVLIAPNLVVLKSDWVSFKPPCWISWLCYQFLAFHLARLAGLVVSKETSRSSSLPLSGFSQSQLEGNSPNNCESLSQPVTKIQVEMLLWKAISQSCGRQLNHTSLKERRITQESRYSVMSPVTGRSYEQVTCGFYKAPGTRNL